MKIDTGFKNISKPIHDCNIYTHPQPDTQAVTRVIPDCGHTYFIVGHVPQDSPLITARCRGCQAQTALRTAQQQWEQNKHTLTVPEVRG